MNIETGRVLADEALDQVVGGAMENSGSKSKSKIKCRYCLHEVESKGTVRLDAGNTGKYLCTNPECDKRNTALYNWDVIIPE